MINNHVLQHLTRISSYIRCLHTIAYAFRFATISRGGKIVDASLTPDELRHASYSIVYNIQQQSIREDFRSLQKAKPLTSHFKYLTPFLDSSSGYAPISVGGRLQDTDIPETKRHPLLLPSKAHFTWIYVRHLHLRNCHAGPKALTALIRLEYWIVNARDLARRVVRSCMACVRFKPKLENDLMGSLPPERVQSQQPFQKCGVDFCGPFNTHLPQSPI